MVSFGSALIGGLANSHELQMLDAAQDRAILAFGETGLRAASPSEDLRGCNDLGRVGADHVSE